MTAPLLIAATVGMAGLFWWAGDPLFTAFFIYLAVVATVSWIRGGDHAN